MKEAMHYPVVLRMAGLFPADLGGYEGHRTRKGGDIGHVDLSRSSMNRRLIGSDDWAIKAQAEIADMAQENFVLELEKLQKRRRKSEVQKRIAEGPRDPWRAGRHGPLREVILTANRKFFSDQTDAESKDLREAQFESLAIAWLKDTFGDDVVHARADLDEEAYHIHAIIVPRAKTKDGRRMLQPSKHPTIKDYETAQDSVGRWFAEIGLKRGTRRAEAIREAKRHNAELRHGDGSAKDVPVQPDHVSPKEWRQNQEAGLANRDHAIAEKEEELGRRQKELRRKKEAIEATHSVVKAVASGEIDLSKANRDHSNPRVRLADRLFGKAFQRMRNRAHEVERDKLHKEYENILKADDLIVEAAKLLPKPARAAIAKVRTSLAPRLVALKFALRKTATSSNDRSKDDDQEKS